MWKIEFVVAGVGVAFIRLILRFRRNYDIVAEFKKIFLEFHRNLLKTFQWSR